VYPGVIDHRTNAYAEFEEQHPGKLVVDEPTFANARRLAAKCGKRASVVVASASSSTCRIARSPATLPNRRLAATRSLGLREHGAIQTLRVHRG
jgi:hypothetical protein